MLVLTRNPGESIWIGQEIQITVLGSSRSKIRIGIDAPPEIKISREKPQAKESLHEN